MKKPNYYYQSYDDKGNSLDKIKYGLLNEYGPNINRQEKEFYSEEKIIKIK